MYFFLRRCGFSEKTASSILERIKRNSVYHGEYHINRLWKKLEARGYNQDDFEYIVLALTILFHDLVYIPGAPDNERKSVQKFLEYLGKTKNHKIKDDVIDEVVQCILLSAPSQYCKILKNTLQYDFVVNFDLDHLVNVNEEELDYITDLIEDELALDQDLERIIEFTEGTINLMEKIKEDVPEAKKGCNRIIEQKKQILKDLKEEEERQQKVDEELLAEAEQISDILDGRH